MTRFTIKQGIVLQRNAAIPEGCSVREFVDTGLVESKLSPDNSFFAVSRRGQILACNLAASLILEGIMNGCDSEQLPDILLEVFEASKQQVSQDVEGIINNLLEENIIQESDS